jgi:UDP:flavonoid glycosyltransferase YjiC (YdhE family)
VRVLFTTVPGFGHLLPLIPVARAVAGAGHEVRVATSASFAEPVKRCGFATVEAGLDWLESEPGAVLPDAGPQGVDRAGRISWTFRGVAPEPMARDLLALADEWRPDLVVFDNVERGGLLFAEATALPSHSSRTTPSSPRACQPAKIPSSGQHSATVEGSISTKRPEPGWGSNRTSANEGRPRSWCC